MKLLHSIYVDLLSLRLQLLLLAFLFNIFVILEKQPQSVVIASIGLLSTCYFFWFAAKGKEADHNHELSLKGLGNIQDFNNLKQKALDLDKEL